MKIAALQLCASDDPVSNLELTLSMVQQAAEAGRMIKPWRHCVPAPLGSGFGFPLVHWR